LQRRGQVGHPAVVGTWLRPARNQQVRGAAKGQQQLDEHNDHPFGVDKRLVTGLDGRRRRA
jgi:hypothetical protein